MQTFQRAIAILVVAAASAAFAAEGTFHKSLTVNGTADVEVQSGSGNITVRAGDVGKVEITGHVHSSYSLFGGGDSQAKVDKIVSNPPVEQNGNWVRIGKIQEDSLRQNVSINYEVVVPKDTRLKANSGSGDVRVDDIALSTEAHTGSGNIRIHNIGADLDVRAGSGDIEAANINGNARVSTGSGNIHIQLAGNGSAHVNAGSGDITADDLHNILAASPSSGKERATCSAQPRSTTASGSV